MKKNESIEINGKKYVLEENVLTTPKPPNQLLRKSRFGKEWLITRIWFGVAKEKELAELIKTVHKKEKIYDKELKKYRSRQKILHEQIPKIRHNSFMLMIKRFTGLHRERALLFDDDGTLAKIVPILPDKDRFSYNKKEYTIDRNDIHSQFTLKRFLEKETFYFYNIGSSGALTINNPISAQYLTPDALYTLLNTQQLKVLNSVGGGLNDLFNDPKKLIILGAIAVGLYLFLSGGLT